MKGSEQPVHFDSLAFFATLVHSLFSFVWSVSKTYCSTFCFTRSYATTFCLLRMVPVFYAEVQKQLGAPFHAGKLCSGGISLIILVTFLSKVRRLTSALRGLSRSGMNPHFACAQGVN